MTPVGRAQATNMTTSPRLVAYFALSILFWLAVALAIFAHLGEVEAYAATVEPQATATPVGTCDLWKTAGGSPVYRCIDEDMYVICYSQGAMLFCLEQP